MKKLQQIGKEEDSSISIQIGAARPSPIDELDSTNPLYESLTPAGGAKPERRHSRQTDDEKGLKGGQGNCTAETPQDETYSQKALIIVKMAIPAVLCMTMSMSQEITNLIFVGHLNNSAKLAGVGMGNMLQNMCGLSIGFGLNSALETLVSQACGAKNLRQCGVYLNRGRFVLAMAFVPVVAVLTQAKNILVMIGQDPEVAEYSQQYIFAYLPGLFLNCLFDGQRRFLNAMGLSNAPLLFQIVGSIMHIFWCWFFVIQNHYDIQGIGYASTISNLTLYSGVFAYCTYIPEIKEAIVMPDKETFTGISQYLSYGIPSASMLCLEWWAFEVMTLIAGYIGVEYQASHIVLMNIIAFLFMFALGLQTAGIATIGNRIGANEVDKARQYFSVLKHLSFIFILSLLIIFMTFRQYVIGIFTEIPSVQKNCKEVSALFAMAVFPDLWQGFLQGPIKALGVQKKVIGPNFVAYWVINLPMSYFMIFHLGMGYESIWISMITAQVFLVTYFTSLINKTDWQEIADSIKDQNKV